MRLPFAISALVPLIALHAANAADWYVAPDGDDTAAGSIKHPFATIQRAQQSASPADTVFIRGGTYRMTEAQIEGKRGIFARITVLDKSGAPQKPITYRAYANEKPVFDCSDVKPPGQRVTAFYVSGSWLHLLGFEVTGVQVTMHRHTQSICFESQGSHNIFERLSMHDGQAIGIYHVRGSDNLFLNCDAWNNWDYTSEDGKGGNVDGFGCHPTQGGTANIFRGCRAWFNSDDGFDCISAHESVTFENCWALYNGLSADGKKLGDGNGFKAGGYAGTPVGDLPNPIPRHVVRQCLAVGNKNSGFYANHHPGGGDWLNNTAYRNGINFNMLCRLADNITDVDGYGHKLINNLSYDSRAEVRRLDTLKCQLASNSFTVGLKLSSGDFVSLDESELYHPRQPDGGLPAIDFLHPAQGSALIDAGVNVGLPFLGSGPDIGAFEQRAFSQITP
jgi:Right handed beta helix region